MDSSVRSWEGSDEHDDSDQGGDDDDNEDLRTMKIMLMRMFTSIIVQSNALRKRGMFVVNPIFFAGFLLSGEFSLSPYYALFHDQDQCTKFHPQDLLSRCPCFFLGKCYWALLLEPM